MKLKKNDVVVIRTGKDKGQTGRVLKVIPEKNLVVVEGLNMVKKTLKAKSQQEKGGIIEVEAALNVSNVALYLKNSATRVRYTIEKSAGKHAKKKRVSSKTGEAV